MANDNVELLDYRKKSNYDTFDVEDSKRKEYEEIPDAEVNTSIGFYHDIKTLSLRARDEITNFKKIIYHGNNVINRDMYLLDLKDEALIMILCFLSPEDLAKMAQTCKRFNALVNCNIVWQTVAAKEGLNFIGASNVKLAYKIMKFSIWTANQINNNPSSRLIKEIEQKRSDNHLIFLCYLSAFLCIVQGIVMGGMAITSVVKYDELKESASFWFALVFSMLIYATLCCCGIYKSMKAYMENINIAFENERIAAHNRLVKEGLVNVDDSDTFVDETSSLVEVNYNNKAYGMDSSI